MTGLQMELFALVGDGNSCGEWAGKTKGSGIYIPREFPAVCCHPSPRPSNLLLLNGEVPPTSEQHQHSCPVPVLLPFDFHFG